MPENQDKKRRLEKLGVEVRPEEPGVPAALEEIGVRPVESNPSISIPSGFPAEKVQEAEPAQNQKEVVGGENASSDPNRTSYWNRLALRRLDRKKAGATGNRA